MTTVKNTEVLYQNYNSVAPLGLICMNGTQELGAKINSYLERWADRNGMPRVSSPATPRDLSRAPSAARICLSL